MPLAALESHRPRGPADGEILEAFLGGPKAPGRGLLGPRAERGYSTKASRMSPETFNTETPQNITTCAVGISREAAGPRRAGDNAGTLFGRAVYFAERFSKCNLLPFRECYVNTMAYLQKTLGGTTRKCPSCIGPQTR